MTSPYLPCPLPVLTLSLLKVAIVKFNRISFRKMLKNKWYLVKVLPKKFHLNGHDRILSIFDTRKLEVQDFIFHSGSKRINQRYILLNTRP